MPYKIKLLLPLLLLPLMGYGEPLSALQKTADFDYLYQVLKENYPFFGVAKRQSGVDWLAKKDEYRARLASTASDSAYVFALQDILNELRSGHLHISLNRWAKDYAKIYKEAVSIDSLYQKWVEVFENPKQRSKYWGEILYGNMPDHVAPIADAPKPKPNYSDTILADSKIAVMTIRSFAHFNIEKDKPQIDSFLTKINHCKALVINIQDNDGGSTKYWKNTIVTRLIRDTIVNVQHALIKDGAMNREFYGYVFQKGHILQKDVKQPKTPDELLTETYYIYEENDTIPPVEPVSFSGKIYLLVNYVVFSASEAFAQFAKSTG